METILAIDPGVTTGYCLGLKRDGEDVLYVAPDEQRFGMDEFYQFVSTFLSESPDQACIVYEDFQYRNYARMGLDLTPAKLIGIIEVFIDRYTPLLLGTKQSPSTGKSFFKDDELKRLGVYVAGKQHGRDATRHLMQWANFGAGGQFFDHDKLQYQLLTPDELWERAKERW